MDANITKDGDIITNSNSRMSVEEFVASRMYILLRSKQGDWPQYPYKGIGFNKYAGIPITPSIKQYIENDVITEMEKDRVLSPFVNTAIFTPNSNNSGILEMYCQLPDGKKVGATHNIQNQGSVVGLDGPIYTTAQYDTTSSKTITEVLTFTLPVKSLVRKYIPTNAYVIVMNYEDALNNINDDGIIDSTNTVYEQNINIVSQTIDVVVGENEFGEELYEQQTKMIRRYKLDDNLISILNTKNIRNINVFIDNALLSSTDYVISDGNIFIIEYKEVVDDNGNTIEIGIEDKTSGTIEIDVNYVNSLKIDTVSNVTVENDPDKIYPRARTNQRYIVLMSKTMPAGKYFVQYNSYKLGE